MKTNLVVLEAIAVLGLLSSAGLLSAGCNAECAGTVQVKARPDQCYSVTVYENGGDYGNVLSEKYCGTQSASVPAGNYHYAASSSELVARRMGTGDLVIACGQTSSVDLDDTNGAPTGAEVLERGCRGLPPTEAVLLNERCKSGQAKVFSTSDVYCSNGQVDYNQWGLVCL